MPAIAYCVLVDESCHAGVVDHLDRAGFDVERAPRAGRPDSLSDEELVGYATAVGRVVLTVDLRDLFVISESYRRRGKEHPGIIVGRQDWGVGGLCRAFERTLRDTPETALRNNVVWAKHERTLALGGD